MYAYFANMNTCMYVGDVVHIYYVVYYLNELFTWSCSTSCCNESQLTKHKQYKLHFLSLQNLKFKGFVALDFDKHIYVKSDKVPQSDLGLGNIGLWLFWYCQYGDIDGWKLSEPTYSYFLWYQSRRPVTKGIWVWSKPVIMKLADDSKVSIHYF